MGKTMIIIIAATMLLALLLIEIWVDVRLNNEIGVVTQKMNHYSDMLQASKIREKMSQKTANDLQNAYTRERIMLVNSQKTIDALNKTMDLITQLVCEPQEGITPETTLSMLKTVLQQEKKEIDVPNLKQEE